MPNWCDNLLHISGPEKDILAFKRQANGPTQSYNDFRDSNGKSWPINDDVRLKAIANTLPDPGEVSVFSFHALFPVPDEVRRLPYDCNSARKMGEKLGQEVSFGGYSWEGNNWGCKWGASNPVLQEHEANFLCYSFDTPWGPPMGFLEKVSKDWSSLTFEIQYEEPGMGFAGRTTYQEGEVTAEEDWEIEYDEDEEDCDE